MNFRTSIFGIKILTSILREFLNETFLCRVFSFFKEIDSSAL